MSAKTSNVTETAMQFFGFHYPPFADTFEVHEPFCSEAETRALRRICAFVKQGKSIAVYGESGTGKSMFMKSLSNCLDTKQYRVAHIPYAGIKPALLLREICEKLDVDTSGRKGLLARLAQDFQITDCDKPFPVIIVDEAHTMDKQSFLDLCSLMHDAKTRKTSAVLILVGQTALRKMLELDIFTPVRTRLGWRMQTQKLSIDEAKNFINYRLKLAKAKSDIFEDEALDCLAADSKGNRRMIMNMAAACLEEAVERKDKIITPEIVNAIVDDYQ